MASAIPVLPLVASMSVAPGRISPRRSAPITIESAGRSFTEPAGLLPSSLAKTALPLAPGMRCRRTRGVLPMKRSRVALMPQRKAPRGAGLRSENRWASLLRRVLVVLLGVLRVGLGFGGLLLGIGLGFLGLLLRLGLVLLRLLGGLGLRLLGIGLRVGGLGVLALGLGFLRLRLVLGGLLLARRLGLGRLRLALG